MKPLKDSLFLIDLDQPVMALRQFISSYVLVSGDTAVVIDPGPSSTIDTLLLGLKDLGVEKVAAVLLTHIHIDHAGGTGDLLDHFPGTPVLCHPKGARHLVDPSRLWEGSVKVLGSLAETYGPIKPVPEDLLFYDTEVSFAGFTFQIIETPGHAKHHLSLICEDILFAGEALGTFMPGPEIYIRMATPPVFSHEEFIGSIDRLAGYPVNTVCFAHYGLCNKPREAFDTARGQLNLWVDIIRRSADHEAALEAILKQDPILKHLESMPEDVREREIYFIGNSVRGIAPSKGV